MKTDGLFIQHIIVSYDGKKYSANPLNVLNSNYNSVETTNHEVVSIPSAIESIADMEETDATISLKFGKIIFNLDAAGEATFTSEYDKTITFDKATLRATGDKLTKDDFSSDGGYYSVSRNRDLINRVIIEYLNAVCKCNANVYSYLKSRHQYLYSIVHNPVEIKNFINIISFNLLEFEKLINSGNEKLIAEGLDRDDFELADASKLHQVIGIPKVAVGAIKDLKLEFALSQIKTLADTLDGNSLKIFFEFFQNFKIILNNYKTYTKENDICKFIEDFTEVSKQGYRTPDLLNYIMKQNFYYSASAVFSFPFLEIGLLKDYLHMANIYNVKVDKYPSQLKKQHDLLAKNVSSLEKLSPELEAQFKAAVTLYEDVAREITVDLPCKKGEKPETETYSFIVPTKIKDIIQEGNDLHHCVGSYSDRIINGDSRIVFMRLKGHERESLITVDISEDHKLIEAAGMGNCELNDIQNKALKAWLKEIATV